MSLNTFERSMLGLTVIEVEAGYEVEKDGKKLTVDDQNAVKRGGKIFVTKAVFEGLKAHPAVLADANQKAPTP